MCYAWLTVFLCLFSYAALQQADQPCYTVVQGWLFYLPDWLLITTPKFDSAIWEFTTPTVQCNNIHSINDYKIAIQQLNWNKVYINPCFHTYCTQSISSSLSVRIMNWIKRQSITLQQVPSTPSPTLTYPYIQTVHKTSVTIHSPTSLIHRLICLHI